MSPALPVTMADPNPNSHAIFWLVPMNSMAEQAVYSPYNRPWVSIHTDGTPRLRVGQVQSAEMDGVTLATLGRNGDIIINSARISRIKCAFEIDTGTGIVMLYDKSHNQTTQVYGDKAIQFERGRVRKIVVRPGLNTVVSMGGPERNPIEFELQWNLYFQIRDWLGPSGSTRGWPKRTTRS